MHRHAIKALSVGWLCAAITVVVTYAVPSIPPMTQIILIVVVGVSSTLFMLARG